MEREGISIVHPAKFIMIGSGNPAEGELRPQLLDRFGLSGELSPHPSFLSSYLCPVSWQQRAAAPPNCWIVWAVGCCAPCCLPACHAPLPCRPSSAQPAMCAHACAWARTPAQPLTHARARPPTHPPTHAQST